MRPYQSCTLVGYKVGKESINSVFTFLVSIRSPSEYNKIPLFKIVTIFFLRFAVLLEHFDFFLHYM